MSYWVFCFGSNTVKQIATRVQTSEEAIWKGTDIEDCSDHSTPRGVKAAWLDGYVRAFAGVTPHWGMTSPATVIPCDVETSESFNLPNRVEGIVVALTEPQLTILDGFEHIGVMYRREQIQVSAVDGVLSAQVYIKIDLSEFVPTSPDYL